MPRSITACLLAALLAGCAAHAEPASPAEAASRLRESALSYAQLHAAAAKGPERQPLQVRESGFAGLTLGASQADVKTLLGEPTRQSQGSAGSWWEYDSPQPSTHLRLLFGGTDRTLLQIQAWPPGRFLTRTLIRLLDPAERVTRKYGPPPQTLDWGNGALAWIYPAANVAYVVTPVDADGRRWVAGILVGL